MKIKITGIALLLWLASSAAYAAYIERMQWSLEDVVFDDGGTASGTFFTTTTTTTGITDVSVFSTSGTAIAGVTYSSLGAAQVYGVGDFINLFTDDLPGTTGERALVLWLEGFTTQAINDASVGDVIQVSAQEFVCLSEEPCSFSSELLRDGRGVFGRIRAVKLVPIPAAVWLFGSGLGLLGWLKRRQSGALPT